MCIKIFKSIDTKKTAQKTSRYKISIQISFHAWSMTIPKRKIRKKSIYFLFLKLYWRAKLKKKNIYLFLPGLYCGMWDLVPWLGTEHKFSALGVWSLGHWTKNLIYNSIEKNEVIRNKLKEMKDLYVENYKILLKEIWHK